MTASRDEHLGAIERCSQALAVLARFRRRQSSLKGREIITLFILDVLGQIRHQLFEGWYEFRGRSIQVLEPLQLLFPLLKDVSAHTMRDRGIGGKLVSPFDVLSGPCRLSLSHRLPSTSPLPDTRLVLLQRNDGQAPR